MPTLTPTALPPVSGNQYAETISAFSNLSIGMAALFVLALFAVCLIVYVYYNRNKGQGEQALLVTFSQAMGTTLRDRDERIEALEDAQQGRDEKYIESLSAIGDGMNRIADVVTHFQKRESEHDRILSDATSAMTAIVTVGSKPLQQVVKDVGALQATSEEIQKAVTQIFDRYMLTFPTKRPIDDMFEHLKAAVIAAIEKKCGDQIHTPQEPPVSNVVNVNTGTPAEKPGDEGSAAA